MPTNTKLAYFAGLFDGEGTVGIRRITRKEKTLYVWVSMNMCDAIVLRELHSIYGGSMHFVEKSIKNPKWRDLWVWAITSKSAYPFLRDIYPFTMIKKQQICLALHFQEEVWKFKRSSKYGTPINKNSMAIREEIKKKLHELKHISVNGVIENEANSVKSCDANAELNSGKSPDKCVETIYLARKG